MKKKVVSLLLTSMMVLTMLAGCGSKDGAVDADKKEDKKHLVIGTSTVSIDLAESGVEALEEMGYEVEIKSFDDYFLPNQALVEGSLDANLYQHEPFLDTYNEENDTDIVMAEPKLWNFWAGIYSVKADSLEELPDGGLVGIAQDASNISEDLKRLESVGLIKLTDEEKEFYDIADIVENPHNWEFVQSDHTKYKNMDDYTLIIGTSNTMASAGVDPTKNLLKSFEDDTLAEGMCFSKENADTQWAKDIMKAYSSDSAKKAVPETTGFKAIF